MQDIHILVVEDEETLCDILKFNLEREGYKVDIAFNAEEALRLDLSRYQLLLLDVMMGEISGLRLAQIVRANPETAATPIIFVTAVDSVDRMVEGLNLGADDYITKPYSLKNVVARVRSVLRRTYQRPTDAKPASGLVVDQNLKRCRIDGANIDLSKREFELLSFLYEHPGKIYSREELLNKVWPHEVVVLDRTIDVNITRLRHKLGRFGNCLITRKGYGYGYSDEVVGVNP